MSLPFVVFYFTARLLVSRAYWHHFGERLGFLPQRFNRTKSGSIWLHAASAGEIASAIPLILELRAEQPFLPIYLSTSTIAGRTAAVHRASSIVNGVFFCPLDYVSCVRRVLRVIRPALLIVLETEIWPNLYSETKRSGARLVIVNGRISNRAWPRYRAAKTFFAPIMQLPDAVFAQSLADHDRYAELGVPHSRLELAGNLKYDAARSTGRSGLSTFGAEQIWVAASTTGPNEAGSLERHSIDEDDLVIDAFQALAQEFPRLLLILAPRQPARFDLVAGKLQHKRIRYVRRTALKVDALLNLDLPGVILLDTIGELAGTFQFADVVFIGGSIAPRGGHNILEPASAGVPVIVGPHMENFEAIATDFIEAGAVLQIRGSDELLPAVRSLLTDRTRAREIANHALEIFEQHRGVARQVARSLWPLYDAAFLKTIHGLFAKAFLGSLAFLWCKGSEMQRRRHEQRATSLSPLPVPVVSVGGIAIGGSGKTPFTNYLAIRLAERGYSPAILTRGYRRRSPAENLVFSPAARVPSAFTGDEAQIFLRAGVAPIGIGRNRYQTGQVLVSEFPATDVLLLDDGFQHARLDRDFDIVLIDGLDPFGQEHVVPLGRLREPLKALSRAKALIISRVESISRYHAICARLREYNARAPIFRTRLIARRWCNYRGECIEDFRVRRVGAFCGLGNPESFWNTLESVGLEVVFRWAFEDHHHYKPVELQRIAHQARVHGAEILVTTEKDRINCPRHLETAIAPLELAWLEIQFELDDEAGFFSFLEQKLRHNSIAPARSAES